MKRWDVERDHHHLFWHPAWAEDFHTFTLLYFHNFTLSLLHTFTLLHFHVFTLCFTLLWAPSLSRGLSHVFTISLFHFVYLVVGTPLELSTLNHSSLVSFPSPSLSARVNIRLTCKISNVIKCSLSSNVQMSANVQNLNFKCHQMFIVIKCSNVIKCSKFELQMSSNVWCG